MTEGTRLARVLAYYGYLENNIEENQKIICPFHSDVNPSMIVDLEKGSFYCFGCNITGHSAIDFILKKEKIDELQALILLSKILRNKKLYDIQDRKYVKKQDDKQLYLKAQDYYYGLKQIDWRQENMADYILEAREYMLKRGLTKKILNLAQARYTYNNHYSIVFPILDNNVFKGWVSRTTLPEIEKTRKYLYNTGFRRNDTLSGTYDKNATVVIVEGTMDMYKFKMCGIRNVVAILGWKITDNQIKKLKKQGINNVISALDNDECGRRGTKELRKHFNVTRWKYLKSCKDPGEFTKESFQKMYDKTMQSK